MFSGGRTDGPGGIGGGDGFIASTGYAAAFRSGFTEIEEKVFVVAAERGDEALRDALYRITDPELQKSFTPDELAWKEAFLNVIEMADRASDDAAYAQAKEGLEKLAEEVSARAAAAAGGESPQGNRFTRVDAPAPSGNAVPSPANAAKLLGDRAPTAPSTHITPPSADKVFANMASDGPDISLQEYREAAVIQGKPDLVSLIDGLRSKWMLLQDKTVETISLVASMVEYFPNSIHYRKAHDRLAAILEATGPAAPATTPPADEPAAVDDGMQAPAPGSVSDDEITRIAAGLFTFPAERAEEIKASIGIALAQFRKINPGDGAFSSSPVLTSQTHEYAAAAAFLEAIGLFFATTTDEKLSATIMRIIEDVDGNPQLGDALPLGKSLDRLSKALPGGTNADLEEYLDAIAGVIMSANATAGVLRKIFGEDLGAIQAALSPAAATADGVRFDVDRIQADIERHLKSAPWNRDGKTTVVVAAYGNEIDVEFSSWVRRQGGHRDTIGAKSNYMGGVAVNTLSWDIFNEPRQNSVDGLRQDQLSGAIRAALPQFGHQFRAAASIVQPLPAPATAAPAQPLTATADSAGNSTVADKGQEELFDDVHLGMWNATGPTAFKPVESLTELLNDQDGARSEELTKQFNSLLKSFPKHQDLLTGGYVSVKFSSKLPLEKELVIEFFRQGPIAIAKWTGRLQADERTIVWQWRHDSSDILTNAGFWLHTKIIESLFSKNFVHRWILSSHPPAAKGGGSEPSGPATDSNPSAAPAGRTPQSAPQAPPTQTPPASARGATAATLREVAVEPDEEGDAPTGEEVYTGGARGHASPISTMARGAKGVYRGNATGRATVRPGAAH